MLAEESAVAEVVRVAGSAAVEVFVRIDGFDVRFVRQQSREAVPAFGAIANRDAVRREAHSADSAAEGAFFGGSPASGWRHTSMVPS